MMYRCYDVSFHDLVAFDLHVEYVVHRATAMWYSTPAQCHCQVTFTGEISYCVPECQHSRWPVSWTALWHMLLCGMLGGNCITTYMDEDFSGLQVIFNSYSASHDNWCTATLWNRTTTAQCEGMGEVGSARYEPALLPPCPSIRVLSYRNCQEIHSRQQTGLAV